MNGICNVWKPADLQIIRIHWNNFNRFHSYRHRTDEFALAVERWYRTLPAKTPRTGREPLYGKAPCFPPRTKSKNSPVDSTWLKCDTTLSSFITLFPPYQLALKQKLIILWWCQHVASQLTETSPLLPRSFSIVFAEKRCTVYSVLLSIVAIAVQTYYYWGFFSPTIPASPFCVLSEGNFYPLAVKCTPHGDSMLKRAHYFVRATLYVWPKTFVIVSLTRGPVFNSPNYAEVKFSRCNAKITPHARLTPK